MNIRLPYLGRQFVSPFAEDSLSRYANEKLEEIIPGTGWKIDPYWHFVHLYGENYNRDDARFLQIRIDGINLTSRRYSNMVHFDGMSGSITPLRDFLWKYSGVGNPSTSLRIEDWQSIDGVFPEIEAKEGIIQCAIELSKMPRGLTSINAKFINSGGDVVYHDIKFQIVRAPIYCYSGPVGSAIGLEPARILTYFGPKECSKLGNLGTNIVHALVWFGQNVGTLVTIGKTITIARKELIEQLAKKIKKTVSEEIQSMIRDKVVVQSLGSMAQDLIYPYELFRHDVRVIEDSSYSRYMIAHMWSLDCYECPDDSGIYEKVDETQIVACTIGSMTPSGFAPKLTRWNVCVASTDMPDPFSRTGFRDWLAPYEYQYLPIQGRRLQHEHQAHPAKHGTGLLFPILNGLPNQPDLLGYHEGFAPPTGKD